MVVADLLASKRERAERLGAAGSFDPTAPDAVESALALLGGPAAVVIDCVARESSVAQAVDLVDKGGAIMIVGVAAGATPVRLDLIQDRELALIGNLMYVREDYTAAIDLLASGAVPIDEIITARFDFEHAAEAFTASMDPENVKVIVSVGDGAMLSGERRGMSRGVSHELGNPRMRRHHQEFRRRAGAQGHHAGPRARAPSPRWPARTAQASRR